MKTAGEAIEAGDASGDPARGPDAGQAEPDHEPGQADAADLVRLAAR